MDFQTPHWCCEYMASLLPPNAKNCLEPTAGEGNLLKVLQRRLDVATPDDFWEMDFDSRFDCICMNPPFSPMRVGYAILYKCMEMTDNLVALMPWLAIINSERRTTNIMQYGLVSVTHLPRKTFAGSRVQCCVLQMKRCYKGTTEFRCINPAAV